MREYFPDSFLPSRFEWFFFFPSNITQSPFIYLYLFSSETEGGQIPELDDVLVLHWPHVVGPFGIYGRTHVTAPTTTLSTLPFSYILSAVFRAPMHRIPFNLLLSIYLYVRISTSCTCKAAARTYNCTLSSPKKKTFLLK
jgi:hypothetical protein